MKDWIETHHLENRIFIHGALSRNEVYEYLTNPSIFVFPSCYEEAFGLVLIEAMSLGIPVVATDIGAIPEVLGESGYENMFPVRDSSVLASKLLELLNNGKKREAASKIGIDLVRQKFTYQVYRSQIDKLMAGIQLHSGVK